MTQRKIAIVIGYGQSNENGTSCKWGTTSVIALTTANAVRDPNILGAPTLKSFGASGMFEYFADAVGRGVPVKLENLAIGQTGLVQDWNGKLQSWTASTSIAGGVWVLPLTPNGFKYLSQNTVAGTTGASAPVWPTAAGATVTDGTGVTWKAYATTAKDVVGYVYLPGEDGYDPWATLTVNGVSGAKARLGSAYAAIAKYKAQGYEVWNITAGGQNDASQPTADITTALTSHVNQAITAGADYVLIGVTPPFLLSSSIGDWGSAARPAPTQGGRVAPGTGGRLVDARNNVLTAFASNPKVKAGADLSVLNDNTICVQETSNAPNLYNIHLNHVGQQIAGKMWYDKVISLGIL